MTGIAHMALLTLALAGQVQRAEAPVAQEAPTAEEIQAAVGKLGADDFRVRQAASDLLWRAGRAAEAALREALKSNDPEVRFRAAAVLDKVRFGILPDTPPDILLLIDQFRHGSSSTVKRQSLLELQAKGQWSTILALLRGEENEQRRRELATAVAGEASKLVRPMIEKGELDQAIEVLELTAVHDPGVAQLTAALLLSGRLDDEMARLAGQLAEKPREEDWRRLAMYQRAKGDLAAAAAAAEKTNDKYLVVNLLAEGREWANVASLMEELQSQNDSQLDHAAFAAAFYHLAGDQAGYDRVLDRLQTAAGMNPEMGAQTPGFPADAVQVAKSWFLIEALLVTEHLDEALAILKKTHPHNAHVLLWRQHRHREALELAGVAEGKALDRAWFDALPAPPGESRSQVAVRMALAGQVARELRELGRLDDIATIVETLRGLAAAAGDQGQRWTQVAALNWQLGRYEEAFHDASQALAAKAAPPTVFGTLLKQQGQLATIWYEMTTAQDPLMERDKAVERAVWLAVPNPPKGKLPADWKEILNREADAAGKLDPQLKLQRLIVLADTARVRGDRDLMRKLLTAAVAVTEPTEPDPFATPGSITAMQRAAGLKLADLSAEDGDWAAAEQQYLAVAKAAPADPLPLYLQGLALTKSKHGEEGEKLMRLAELTALAPESRAALAAGLLERGHKELAAAQFEIVHRTATPDSSLVASAAQQIGNLINGQEPRRAAERWQELHLHVLNANSNFVEVEGYLTLPHVMHKVQAKAALAEGKTDELMAELARCEKVLPGDI
ncbi:MAG TPA: HEAT repeat domain-containing protein, partial [Pirellulaceae bacterium]|nr:HEAT repeat domain-containing protein [Pirellulaceae bacterium]